MYPNFFQTIYLIRHAESAMAGRYCGSIDAPLSKKGERQAKKVGQFFKNIPLEVCYFSDLKRTSQTCQAIQAHKNGTTLFIKTPALREISFGAWEGTTFQEISRGWPKLYKNWIRSPQTTHIPKGEPFPEFEKRIKNFSKILQKNRSKEIAIVAHGGTLALLTILLLKKSMKEFWKWAPECASITILEKNLNDKNNKFNRAK
ncbi:MAG: histidine phosphatase family protein [Elusimicrobia bacterium]|nr:histidine phosphatase family protein [Elusimicrobiota bacterium]